MTATQAPTPGPLSAQQEEAIAFNLCSLHGFDPAFVTTQRDFAFAVIREYERARPSLAPTAPVEASGSERDGPEVGEDAVAKILAPYLPLINSTPDLLSILYDADLMPEQAVTVRGAICVAAVCEAHKAALRPQPSGETREAVLKGVGKINGDGWKDTTTEGEVVFVWNAEKPSPYAPGQYPRVGNDGWSASTSQYDFAPATADDVPAILAALARAHPSPTPAADEDRVRIAVEALDGAYRRWVINEGESVDVLERVGPVIAALKSTAAKEGEK